MDSKARNKEASKVTLQGSLINILLFGLKLLAGVFGRSSAMIADSVHSLSDFATDLVVLITMGVSKKPRDPGHNYGHGKFETLGALIIGLSLLAAGIGLLWHGLLTLMSWFQGERLPHPGLIAFVVAALSILVKEALFRFTRAKGKRLNSPALLANAWHHRSDAFSSIGAFLGIGAALLLGEQWSVLDPLAGVLVSLVVCYAAIKILWSSLHQLLEGAVDQKTRDQILEVAQQTQGISDPHNLRARWVGPELALDLHVRVNPDLTVAQAHELISIVEKRLRAVFGPQTMMNIHVEPEKPQDLFSS